MRFDYQKQQLEEEIQQKILQALTNAKNLGLCEEDLNILQYGCNIKLKFSNKILGENNGKICKS